MKRLIAIVCLLVSLHPGLFAGNPPSQASRTTLETAPAFKYIPGQIVIKFKNEAGRVESNPKAARVFQQASASRVEKVFPWKSYDATFAAQRVGLSQLYVAHVPSSTDIEQLALQLERDPNVEYAEPNYLIPADSTLPNDPLYGDEQHLPQVKAAQAWDIATGDTSVVIGIIDTGVDYDHPDLAANIWNNHDEIPGNNIDDDFNGFIDDTRGWDFVTGLSSGDVWPGEDFDNTDNNPMDFDGHGTHVSGIASAVTNNGVGVASLTWRSKIMPLRIGYHTPDGNGLGSSVWMSQAFVYAADNGADVCNLSFGNSSAVLEGARYAYLNGVVICNSAGNSNTDAATLLGSQSYALNVASVASDDRKASYSTWSSTVDISAPGGDFSGAGGGFLSTLLNPSAFYGGELYGRFQGTSMSSPYVASLAALIKSANPTWTAADIMFQITGTADNIDAKNPNYAGKMGAGRINAYRALTETITEPLPRISFVSVLVTDTISGNNDGRIVPGEDGEVIVTIENSWGDASGVSVTFEATSPAISVTNDTWTPGVVKGIRDLPNSVVSNLSVPFTFSIHPSAFPIIIPCVVTLTADGGIELTYEFDLSVSPSILFVDDDDGLVEIDDAFITELRRNNLPYVHWDHLANGTPSAALMSNFTAVVWGCEWAFPSLDSADRAELSTFLDNGGRLFLSGQDIGWDLCDTTGAADHEYLRSDGASKTWYETYLHNKYLEDDQNGSAASTTLNGVTGDSIGDGVTFSAAEEFRGAANQYPDVIQSLSGSSDVFRYTDSKVGAIRYAGSSRVVYFGFGGLESITDDDTRALVFKKVMNWLNLQSIEFTELDDTEDTTSAITITADISSGINPVTSATLYWDTDGAMPFNEVSMTDLGGGEYSGDLPPTNATANVEYVVIATTSGGEISAAIRSFRRGIDQVFPEISISKAPENSIHTSGPFSVSFTVTDNIGIDPDNAYVHYHVNGGTDTSVNIAVLEASMAKAMRMVSFGADPQLTFEGEFGLGSPAASGDTVYYYVTARDNSSSLNESRFPSSGYNSVRIGTEVVDNFETVKAQWNYGNSWGRSTGYPRSGTYSMTDSPSGNYPPNSSNALTFTTGFDLTPYDRAKMYFYKRHILLVGDTCHLERSQDGVNWVTMKKYAAIDFSPYKKDSLGLPAGEEMANVQFRFRLVSNGSSEADGIYIEDFEVKTDNFLPPSGNFRAASYTFAFDSVNVDTLDTKTDSVTVTNTGTLALAISAVQSNHAAYTVSPSSATIEPSGSRTFVITFAPTAVGPASGLIKFTHDGSSQIDVVLVEGVGSTQYREVPASYGNDWNLVSIPVEPESTTVLPSLFVYDGKYEVASELAHGRGYWAKPASSVTYKGLPVYSDSMDVEERWNLIGSITNPVAVGGIGSNPSGIVTSSFIEFDPDSGYLIADTLEPGKGYWVKSSAAGKLFLDGTGAASKAGRPEVFATLERSNSIRFVDAAGKAQTLFFGSSDDSEADRDRLELPPVPPAGIFDVRFTTSTLLTVHEPRLSSPAEFVLQTQSVTYPLTISWNVGEGRRWTYSIRSVNEKTGKTNAKRLGTEGSMVIPDAGWSSIRLIAEEYSIPTVFALHQNYPNPFNPSSVIRYELPSDSRVKLTVYDVVGREVATLVESQQAAGFYTVEFLAGNLSSGVYFYRLHATYTDANGGAGSYQSIQKMMVMK